MTNINNSKLIYDNKEQNNIKKIVIITSIDDDKNKILSYLNPSNIETFVVDLNNTNLINEFDIKNTQSLSSSKQDTTIDNSKNTNIKKRKADLTCVVCGGQAIGYNFTQISCESCKAFFRRNAIQPIEKTKCIKSNDNINEVRCNIRYDIKHKCQRCRLIKCFQQGMCKDYILTPEEKQSKNNV